jgi:hypothetical protein
MGGGSFFVRLLALHDALAGQQLDGFPHCAAAYLFYFTRTSDPTTSQCALWGNISTGVKPSAR